jgi:hypothetical protein
MSDHFLFEILTGGGCVIRAIRLSPGKMQTYDCILPSMIILSEIEQHWSNEMDRPSRNSGKTVRIRAFKSCYPQKNPSETLKPPKDEFQ